MTPEEGLQARLEIGCARTSDDVRERGGARESGATRDGDARSVDGRRGARLYDDTHIDHDVRVAVFDGAGRRVRDFEGWDFDDDAAVVVR